MNLTNTKHWEDVLLDRAETDLEKELVGVCERLDTLINEANTEIKELKEQVQELIYEAKNKEECS
jgi:hypothetical protein